MRRPAFFVLREREAGADTPHMAAWLPFLLFFFVPVAVLVWVNRRATRDFEQHTAPSREKLAIASALIEATSGDREEIARRREWTAEHWHEIAEKLRARGFSEERVEEIRSQAPSA
jgi:hypothetical protein